MKSIIIDIPVLFYGVKLIYVYVSIFVLVMFVDMGLSVML